MATNMALSLADHPIDVAADDLLGRASLARALATELARVEASHGAVAAITGPWGSGKTSILNMVAEQLEPYEDVIQVRFNPWLFSGAEQLTRSFLNELGQQLEGNATKTKKLRQAAASIAARLAKYGAALSLLEALPYGGILASTADTALQISAGRSGPTESVESQRREITKQLAQLEGRIVVLVDDIDRLTPDEIRELFRVVRLTASFPNLVYVLCLDLEVVQKSLAAFGIDGQEYLAKILTITCQVPNLPMKEMNRLFLESLTRVLEGRVVGPFDETRWADVFVTIIAPRLRTLRDAKRLLASLPLALESIGDEIALVDVLALEAIRVLTPSTYDVIRENVDALTETGSVFGRGANPAQEAAVSRLKDVAGEPDARNIILQLLPTAANEVGGGSYDSSWTQTWLRSRRVAHHRLLSFYFERQYDPGVAPASATAAVANAVIAGDVARFVGTVQHLDAYQLEQVLDELIGYVDEIPSSSVGPIIPPLFELFSSLRGEEESRGMFDFGSEFAVTRLALRLLRKVDADQVFELARSVIRQSSTLFGAFEMETLVGHRENAGSKLVSPEQDEQLRNELRDRLTHTEPHQLAAERNIVRMLFHIMEPSEASEPVVPQMADAEVAAAVLRDGVSPVRSQTLGSAAVQVTYRLNWDILLRIFGGESGLQRSVQLVKQSLAENDERLSRALDLYEKYASGWRPDDY